MTDEELRDAAVAHLLQTTSGYRKPNGQTKPPPWPEGSAHWKPALDYLAQIGVTPEPPTGTVLYHHTYTGAQAVAPTYGWDWGFMLEGNATAQIIPDGLAPGVPAMRATLPPQSSGHMHVEGQKKWLPWTVGERRFFGQQFRLPSNWQNPGPWGAAIAQLYYPNCVNHNWGLLLWGDHCRFVLLSGKQTLSGTSVIREYNNGDGAAQGPSPRAITPGRLVTGKLHTLISEVVVKYDWTGLTRIWHKIEGEANYTKTVDVQNIPTLQYGMCYNGTTIPEGATHNVAQKFGFYAGATNHTRVFDSGNYVIAESFDAVASRMA